MSRYSSKKPKGLSNDLAPISNENRPYALAQVDTVDLLLTPPTTTNGSVWS